MAYQHPLVIGVSQVTTWGPTMTVNDVLAQLGRNSGNMMFTEAIMRALPSPKAGTFRMMPDMFDGCDSIVLACANWINEFEDFGWLADALERTKLPVFMVGIGAQAGLDMQAPKVPAGTLRLLRLVADRSAVISTRGDFTSEVLLDLGITSAVSTGCPSLLLADTEGAISLRPVSTEHPVLHGTRHGFGPCGGLQRHIYREAVRLDADLLLQSEDADIYFALGKISNPDILARALPVIAAAYETDDPSNITEYLRVRGKFFREFKSWIAYMKTRDFCVGTRIHGTVASIIAGTPALLIAHDSRTKELAEIMNIPHVSGEHVDLGRPLDLDALAAQACADRLAAGYPAYRAGFARFFNKNDLASTIM